MVATERRDPQTYAIIGAAMEVHRILGAGFLEPVYQDALALELGDRDIEYLRESPMSIDFKGRRLTSIYRPDFVCFARVIVEVKALRALTTREEAQAINYLKATRLELALLLNFGARSLEYKRFVLSGRSPESGSAEVPHELHTSVA